MTTVQDSIDMVFHYVKVKREADVYLSWMPELPVSPYWTPEKVQRFHDYHHRRLETSRFRLQELLPNIANDAIPRGLSHEDPEVRRILLQELTRRRAAASLPHDGVHTSTAYHDAHRIEQERTCEGEP